MMTPESGYEVTATYALQISTRVMSSSLRLTPAYLRELEENIADILGVEFEVRIAEWDEEEDDG